MVNSILYGSLIIAGSLIYLFWGNIFAVLAVIVLWYPGVLFLSTVCGLVCAVLGIDISRVYEELEEINTDDADKEDNLEQINITKISENIIGRFMDHDIYEWIEVQRNGQPLRLTFLCGLKNGDTYVADTFSVVLPSGLVYSEESK